MKTKETLKISIDTVVNLEGSLKDDYRSNYPSDVNLNELIASKMEEDEAYSVTIVLIKT